MSTTRFLILGPLQVVHEGQDIPIRRGKLRALLAMLLLGGGRSVPVDRLIGGLWGDDPPDTAIKTLQTYISQLRTLLEPGRDPGSSGDLLATEHTGYRLRAEPGAIDASRFESLVEQAAGRSGADPAAARDLLAEALGLWRGPALADFADAHFAEGEITRLEELRLTALEQRLAADLALGRHDLVIAELRDLVRHHPLRETLWEHLMVALYRGGQQAAALETYDQVRRRLAEELGADPSPPLRRLHAAILRHDATLDLPTGDGLGHDAPPNNLPAPLTSFIGRETELAELHALLADRRLVTLTGVGGAGKSRLALEAARTGLAGHPDGSWLIELAALTQPNLVAHVVAATLGVREHPQRTLVDQLVDRLRTADALLVLDNCEHLIGAVAELAHTLLSASTRLRILATSRERLGITGEAVRQISGLAVPGPGADSPAALKDVDAVRLLVERAGALDPDFRLQADTAAATAQISRRLDGLPLAIELAAASVNSLGVDHITARLDDRFRLLTRGSRTAPARHQTLRAAVDWSYGLLTAPERRLFNRLSVFAGGFTLDAAEAVCAEPDDAPEPDDALEPIAVLLARLVDKSLVATASTAADTRRYRMLETLRTYGGERLAEAGETDRTRDRHATYVLTLVETANTAVRGAQQFVWLRRLETEHGNIRAALTWAHARGDTLTSIRLVGAMQPLWDRHGHYSEALRWLGQALAMDGPVPATARARALDVMAGLAAIRGDVRQATDAGEQAAALFRQADDVAGVARTLQHLGLAAVYSGDLGQADKRLEESLRQAQVAGDGWLQSWSLLFLALVALAGAEHERATDLTAECETVLGAVGDPECLAWALIIRAAATWRLGRHDAARAPLHRGLRGFHDLRHVWGLSIGLFLAAQLTGARGDTRQMTVMLGASEAIRDSIGVVVLPFVQPWLVEAVAYAGTTLGAEAFSEAWNTGQALSLDAANALALRESDPAT
ncbi:MAG TPA: BTAD domain-containing putative transcriptional regulator [Streptosporangiaceae bacterium]